MLFSGAREDPAAAVEEAFGRRRGKFARVAGCASTVLPASASPFPSGGAPVTVRKFPWTKMIPTPSILKGRFARRSDAGSFETMVQSSPEERQRSRAGRGGLRLPGRPDCNPGGHGLIQVSSTPRSGLRSASADPSPVPRPSGWRIDRAAAHQSAPPISGGCSSRPGPPPPCPPP